MRKILKLFNIVFATSIISLPLVPCNEVEYNQKYFDISNITMELVYAPIELNKDIYNTALNLIKTKVQTEIINLVSEGKKPENGTDYKIMIPNRDNYDVINKLEELDINICALNNSHILKGSFTAYLQLVPKSKDISNIKINDQKSMIKINTTTFKQALALKCLPLIEIKIATIVPQAEQDYDYVVNVEGHSLSEAIKKLDNVRVNVNAIENHHHLLHGSFSFLLGFEE